MFSKIYKRSEITPAEIRQWELEAAQELILSTADNGFDLCMQIGERLDEIVELQPSGEITTADGCPVSWWRQSADGRYIEYWPPCFKDKPGIDDMQDVTLPSNVIRGPW